MLEGHFLLSSGLHSPIYWEKFRILQHPEFTGELCRLIADHFRVMGVGAVAGPALGGAVLAYEVARLLGVKAVYAERGEEGRAFRRGQTISPGEKVLIVDDVLTTGGSLREMLEAVKKVDDKVTDPKSEVPLQPEYAKNEYRSIKPEFLVLVGICTHLGCSPQQKSAEAKGEMGADWAGGFLCPCHGSKFDLAGRVYKGAPAPVNLEVPPHTYLSDGTIRIGEDRKGA